MNPLLIIVIALLVLSGIGLIIFILLHSGKGTGVCRDMIASSVYSTQTGTSIVEKNLDRITIVLAIVFMASLIALMIIYPHGRHRGQLGRRCRRPRLRFRRRARCCGIR